VMIVKTRTSVFNEPLSREGANVTKEKNARYNGKKMSFIVQALEMKQQVSF
jgi:hypothetical protein